jgi:hypothetical protein
MERCELTVLDHEEVAMTWAGEEHQAMSFSQFGWTIPFREHAPDRWAKPAMTSGRLIFTGA